MKIIKVRDNQSLLDIALQEYGDVRRVYELAADNDLKSIVDTLDYGRELNIKLDTGNKGMQTFLSDYEIKTLHSAHASGIGFWKIGNDFIVI